MTALRQLKIRLRRLQQIVGNVRNGRQFVLAKPLQRAPDCPFQIETVQEIKSGAYFEPKVFNLRRAAARINRYVLLPGQVFSFWHAVGNPQHGYQKSRSIANGVLKEETGGGLCQASGLLYYLALRAGLEVLERHNHSVDIYTEAERFAPLGSDATVVYGYKDLQIRNLCSFPVRFEIEITGDQAIARLWSTQAIVPRDVAFTLTENEISKTVVATDEQQRVLGRSVYKIPL